MITPEWWFTVICDDCDEVAWCCPCGDNPPVTSGSDPADEFLQAYAGEHHIE